MNIKNNFLWMANDLFLFRLSRVMICYLLVVWVIGIYYNYKKSGKTFNEYIFKTFIKIFKTNLIYGIFAIGLAIVFAIFVYLILGGKGYLLILRVEILLTGLYYIPTMIYNFCNPEEENGKFAKIVIKYVLGTLVILAFAIIYMYIIKIILLRDIPSNQIFRILTALFVVGLPTWTMIQSFKEESLFDTINNKLPILFIPFIFLQIYAIGVRIITNGVTISRYLCVMVIIFEIIYTIIYLKNKEKIGNIFIVFAILTIISTIVPYINMVTLSNLSQQRNMRIYTKKQEYTDEEIVKIYGGYNYLKQSIEAKNYISKEDERFIENELKLKDKNNVLSLKQNDQMIYIYARKDIDEIDVEGYKKLHKIKSNSSYLEETIDDLLNDYIKFETDGGLEFNLNISYKIKEYIEHARTIDSYFEYENEIQLDNKKILLTDFSITYNNFTKEISYYSIYGYLLEK